MDRQKYNIKSEYGQEILAKENHTIKELRAEIQKSDHFHKYTKNQKHQLLKGKWRDGFSWTDIGHSADFHTQYFENIYNYLCGYSHSSYASVFQIDEARSIDDQQMLASTMLGVGVVLMGHFTFSYPSVFPEAEYVLSTNPEARRIAESNRFGSDDMSEFYDG